MWPVASWLFSFFTRLNPSCPLRWLQWHLQEAFPSPALGWLSLPLVPMAPYVKYYYCIDHTVFKWSAFPSHPPWGKELCVSHHTTPGAQHSAWHRVSNRYVYAEYTGIRVRWVDGQGRHSRVDSEPVLRHRALRLSHWSTPSQNNIFNSIK